MDRNFPYAIFNTKFDPARDRNEISKRLLSHNFRISNRKSSNAFYDLLNVETRLILNKKREVHLSKNLVCPPEHRSGFERLISKMKRGLDVNHYLSKGIYNTKKNDGMLLDFGLHHFHLGEGVTLDKSGNSFAERTGPLLVAMVKPDDVYCLGIFSHDENLWVDTNLIKLIHTEWPGALSHGHSRISDIKPDPDSIDRKEFRKLGLNSSVKVDDGVYYNLLGGGFNAAGGSLLAGFNMANNNHYTLLLEHYVPSEVVNIILDRSFASDKGAVKLKLLNTPTWHNNIILHENTGDLYVVGFYETIDDKGHITKCSIKSINARFLSKHAVYNENFVLSKPAVAVISATNCYRNNNFDF